MGHAVPIFHQEPVRLVTVYCVQAYWRDRHKLAQGRFREFRSERQACEAAKAMANRNAGVIVFSVSGNPEADYWREPQFIASFGEVPEIAF